MQRQEKEQIIQMLEDALQVTHSAPDREGWGYHYATGYAQSMMENILQMIRKDL